ncbi:MAG: cation diffusion facilitator family transporter, partial [Pseudomonadales bacterium]|nr:cation diffusion facilitator family transporter [Pseudomonadales bacterium]
MTAEQQRQADERRIARDVTLVGSALDAGLGAAKIVVGAWAGSQALIADGVHSLSDLATDAGVLVVTAMSRKGPDTEHPYGHERFETLGTLALGAVLLVVAGGLAYDSLLRLLEGRFPSPSAPALIVAAVSIASKEWIFRYTRRASERIASPLLLANAWHSRSDAFSSVAVLIGVAGAMAGWPWLDLGAAIVVALIVAWVGWQLIANAAQELVDTGLTRAELGQLRLATLAIDGIIETHRIRSRRMGNAVLVDLDIVVRPDISVSEGHQVAWTLARSLREQFPSIRDVKIHVDPQEQADRIDLPLRAEAEAGLTRHWPQALVARIDRITLHYGATNIDADVFLQPATAADETIAEALLHRAGKPAWLGELRIWS